MAAALKQYTEASRLAAGPSGRRVMALKLWGLGQHGERARLVQRYIAPAPDDARDPARDVYLAWRLQALLPEEGEDASGLGHYLVAKQLAGRGHCDLAIRPATRAIQLGLPDTDFVIEAHLTLARCLHRRRKLAEVSAALGRMNLKMQLDQAGPLPGGTLLQTLDWAARVRWESGDPISPE